MQEGSLSPELYSDTEDDETDTDGATEDDEYYEDDETESGEYDDDDDDDVEIVSGSCSESDGDDEQSDNKVHFYLLSLPALNYAFNVMMEIPRQLILQYIQSSRFE